MASSGTAFQALCGYTIQRFQQRSRQTGGGLEVSTSYCPCLHMYYPASVHFSRSKNTRPPNIKRFKPISASATEETVPQGSVQNSRDCESDISNKLAVKLEMAESREKQCKGSEGVHTTQRAVAKVLAFAAGTLLALQGPQMAIAGIQKVGEFTGSGFIFKDSIEVMSIDDPKVQGVTIYVSDFQRSLTDRLSKDFFNEPSQASISCAQTSPVKITGKISAKEGEEIFSETKNFLAFKTLHVRRIFDEKKNALVYVAYSTRFQNDNDKVSAGRYRTSICTVPLFNAVLQQDGGNGAV